MTTEQYSIGYDEGYQAGWNAAMEASPAQRKPLTFEQRMRIHNECADSISLAIALTEAAHGIKGETK